MGSLWTSIRRGRGPLPPVLDGLIFFGDLSAPSTVVGGGLVTTLGDSSGKGNIFSGGNAPAYTASDSDFNGRPSMTFDGVNDYLISSAIALASAPVLTIGCVIRPTAVATTSVYFESGNSTDPRSVTFFLSTSQAHSLWRLTGDDYKKNTATLVNGTKYRQTSVIDGARTGGNAVQSVYIDGVSSTTTVSSAASSGTFADLAWRIGARNVGSLPYAGKLVDPFIYNRGLTATEIASLDAWLAWRNG